MLNSRRDNKKRKVAKLLQVKDIKIGRLHKDLKKEECTKEKEEQTLEEYVKGRNYLDSKEVYNITLSICETIESLNSLNYSIRCSQFNPENLIVTENKKILIKNYEFSKELQFIDMDNIYIPTSENPYVNQLRLEQVTRDKVIQTIGMLMYFMSTGKLPITMLDPILEDSYGNNVDSNLKRIMQKCFDIDIKNRFISIEELKKEIILGLLIKSKYRKPINLSNSNIDSNTSLENSSLKRIDKRKSKRLIGSALSKISAALSTIF